MALKLGQVCVLGYLIVGTALFVFVQAKNVYPQLLLARLFFSIGGAATATMVTAILPSMTALSRTSERNSPMENNGHAAARPVSPSVSSELTITPARLGIQHSPPVIGAPKASANASPTRLAGLVGIFTGFGALLALGLFLPLPARLQRLDISPGQALVDTYYIVGAVALLIACFCSIGLMKLKGEEDKSWRGIWSARNVDDAVRSEKAKASYGHLMVESLRLGIQNPLIGLGYVGGFVARASSVGISLFIPLFVNAYFISSGLCKIDDPLDVKSQCREAYVLSAKLTGTSQLVALIFAPAFGYLADRYQRFHLPLIAAAISGIVGYSAFASLPTPESNGQSGSPLVFLIVSLLGISQIGSIVCSLGLIGRGITGSPNKKDASNDTEQGTTGALNSSDSVQPQPSVPNSTPGAARESEDDNVDHTEESESLLNHKKLPERSSIHLKGSIAGVYSLAGGAGILLLTKLGGSLFDTTSPASPFYMLAAFNALLLLAAIVAGLYEARQNHLVSK